MRTGRRALLQRFVSTGAINGENKNWICSHAYQKTPKHFFILF